MDFESQATLIWIATAAASILGLIITCLLLYLIIRQGVFHGLRAHSRWVDNGKDYERVR